MVTTKVSRWRKTRTCVVSEDHTLNGETFLNLKCVRAVQSLKHRISHQAVFDMEVGLRWSDQTRPDHDQTMAYCAVGNNRTDYDRTNFIGRGLTAVNLSVNKTNFYNRNNSNNTF